MGGYISQVRAGGQKEGLSPEKARTQRGHSCRMSGARYSLWWSQAFAAGKPVVKGAICHSMLPNAWPRVGVSGLSGAHSDQQLLHPHQIHPASRPETPELLVHIFLTI